MDNKKNDLAARRPYITVSRIEAQPKCYIGDVLLESKLKTLWDIEGRPPRPHRIDLGITAYVHPNVPPHRIYEAATELANRLLKDVRRSLIDSTYYEDTKKKNEQ